MAFGHRFYDLLGAPIPFDPTRRYTTSYLIAPLTLALIRLLLSLYAFTTIFFELAYESTVSNPSLRWSARHSLSYFTNLCYWGLAFYLLVSGLHGLAYHFELVSARGYQGNGKVQGNGIHDGAVTGHTENTGKAPPRFWRRLDLNHWPRILQALHVLFYATIMVFPPLVTIVFWAVLYSNPFWPDRYEQWSNISVHGLNSAVPLLTLFLTRTPPPPPLLLVFVLVILALYLSLAYLTHAVAGFYPYSFLDPNRQSNGVVAGYCIGIAVGACVIFGIIWLLVWFRERLAKAKGWGTAGTRTTRDAAVDGEGTEMRQV